MLSFCLWPAFWHAMFNKRTFIHPDLPDPSRLTERTSDNQCLGTSNDTTSVAKHPTLKRQLD